ncbi:MAG: T9SS type A sorting domain-containing protein [Flavobacteriales bacterium]|nr:T9SS type A sorting domain-containing protein [Flavobacteriales bacterium]NUQ15568.1 T9SS type A sorting domain-containing protein [Flavobacteriales bacterium]
MGYRNTLLTALLTVWTVPLVQAQCSEQLTLTLRTDVDASQTSWEITAAGQSVPICSGGGYTPNTLLNLNCCVDAGCYNLRVFDSFGDGMNPNGYYILYDVNGERIIDNRANGDFGSLSTVANGAPFCLPIGPDRLIEALCDRGDLIYGNLLIAHPEPAVVAAHLPGTPLAGQNVNYGYQFWLFDPNGSYSRRVFIHNGSYNGWDSNDPERASYLNYAWLQTLPVPVNQWLNVRIRAKIAGTYREFGPACRVYFNPQKPPCNTTRLVDRPNDPKFSCGVTKTFGGSDRLYAYKRTSADRYQFEFTHSGSGYLRRISLPTSGVILNWMTQPLVAGNTYNVRVRISYDTGQSWCNWGPTCWVAIGTSPQNDGQGKLLGTAQATVWPNPTEGAPVHIALQGDGWDLDQAVDVHVMASDGRLVLQERYAPAADGSVADLSVSGLAPGAYVLRIGQGERQTIERLVVR